MKFLDFQVGRYLRLRVQDSGCGMSPEVAERAFEPFFTTKQTKGTGLGLSTVRAIVEQAGGRVTLTSEEGKGTQVDVFLPIVQDGVAVDISPPPSSTAPRGRGEVVLVVEDSPSLRKLVCAMLEGNGYRTLDAGAGSEAFAILDAGEAPPALLLTDVILPEMSGREVAVRAREQFGISRVLFMSGYHDDIIVHHGYLEPGTRLLQKPFLEADLLRAVRKSLDEQS